MTDEKLIETICSICGLGQLINTPEPLTGGYMHKMYSALTSSGKYAVKLLDPFIMQREDAAENFRTADMLEAMLEKQSLPILPALTFGGKKMQCINGRYFYVFDYFEGVSLKDSEITVGHCKKIGSTLARIHSTDHRDNGFEPDVPDIDWDGYIKRMQCVNDELYRLLSDNRELLYKSMENGAAALKMLQKVSAVCHNDMDSKNVLWQGDDLRIIDLECLGYSSPVMEAYELALCWSGYESCALDTAKFEAFLTAYKNAGGKLTNDPETLYHSSCDRLEWLGFNVRKSLGEECEEADIPAAQAQVKETLAHIRYYESARDTIISALERIG